MDKSLKKLNRTELLELLLESRKEAEQLKKQLAEANEKLSSRTITIENAGSLAEAALQINKVMEAAQSAADQYLENAALRAAQAEEKCHMMEEESKSAAERLMRETEDKCEAMREETTAKIERLLSLAEQHRRNLESGNAQPDEPEQQPAPPKETPKAGSRRKKWRKA